MISIKNLSKEFINADIKQNVLNNINLEINDNNFITIMGPSGGGKSTLLYCIALLTEPTAGEINFNNEKLNFKNEKNLEKLRKDNIGLIFQNSNLISCLSPLENIIIAMNTNESYSLKKKRAEELLERVGLKNKGKSNVNALSGGEAQRVAIVRALINKPKLLLCDEPTGALDSSNSKKIIELLLELKRETRCTLIIVTHDEKIADLGERRLYLEGGKLYEMDRNI